jgi:hypothetical protein
MNRTICDFTQVAYNLSSIINLGFWAFERAFRCNLFALEKSKKENLSKYQNIALLITIAHFSIELRYILSIP